MKKVLIILDIALCVSILVAAVIVAVSNKHRDDLKPETETTSTEEGTTEVLNKDDYLYRVEIEGDLSEYFYWTIEPRLNLNHEETGEYYVVFHSKKYEEEGLLWDQMCHANIHMEITFQDGSVNDYDGYDIMYLMQGVPGFFEPITDPSAVSVNLYCERQVLTYIKPEFVESYDLCEPYYDDMSLKWYQQIDVAFKDGTYDTRISYVDNPF